MLRIIVLLCCTVVLWGCQTPPDLKKLQDENNALQQQLSQSRDEASQLKADKTSLQQDIAELNRIAGVLGEEKSSRVKEATSLRGQVRQFVQSQIDSLKHFLLASDLLDYIGGELVVRNNVDEKPILVVDLYHPVPRNGTLTGVGGYFQSTGTLSVKVLRPIADKLVVVWSSQSMTIPKTGLQQLSFPVSVGVEKGDYLAYYFNEPGLVGFDTGTGDTRYLNKDVAVGASVKQSSLRGEKNKRAYSVGVFGLLNFN